MAITYIKRITGATNSLVQLDTTDNIATATASGYLTAQNANITALNDGQWTWETNDLIILSASDGVALATINSTFTTIVLIAFSTTVIGAPVVVGDFAVFASTGGNIEDLGYLPSDASKTSVVMASSATIANRIACFTDTTGTIDDTTALATHAGNIAAGLSGTAGTLTSFPASAANGSFIFASVGNAGNFAATLSPKSTLGQATVYTLPDPGAATANIVLDAGTAAAVSVNNLKYGATPVAQVDPGSCTITAAAGAANHCTITIQLKDGSGTNMTRVVPFKVYLATDATGLTLQSAASTGYSVTSGGVKDPTGSTTITQGLAAFASATGGCVVDLLDTGKGTGNLILMFANGFKASAAITSGSYG